MNKKNPINISKSSLVGLQAELARKREELARNHHPNEKKSKKLELKPHIQEQLKNSKQKVKTKVPDWKEEEEDDSAALNQSKDSLITKSALYEKLRSQELKATNDDQFLVDFGKNESEDGATNKEEDIDEDCDPDSEWITFTDSLGRTRTCLRADVSYYKQLDSKLSVEKAPEKPTVDESVDQPQSNRRPIVLSEEMRLWDEKREKLRTMWEEEEKKLMNKKDIHYQDVLFDEARVHGVGYYQFSKDETERQKQLEELHKLREETARNQQLSMSLKERRAQQMKHRIAAAKRRKCERLGIPFTMEDNVADEEIEEEKKEEPQPEEILAKKVEEYLQSVERSRHVRPWDVGKDGVKNTRVLDQQEYNEMQRAKRVQEFAPPTTYKIDVVPKDEPDDEEEEERGGLRFTTVRKKRNFVENIPIPSDTTHRTDSTAKKREISDRQGIAIPPPSSYDETTSRGKPKSSSLSESIEMGLNRLKHEAEMKSKRKRPFMEEII